MYTPATRYRPCREHGKNGPMLNAGPGLADVGPVDGRRAIAPTMRALSSLLLVLCGIM